MISRSENVLTKGKLVLEIEKDGFIIKNIDLKVYPIYFFSGRIFIENIIRKTYCLKAVCRAEMDETIAHIVLRLFNNCVNLQFYYYSVDEVYVVENFLPLFVINTPLEDIEIIIQGKKQPQNLYEYKYCTRSFSLRNKENEVTFYLSNLVNGLKEIDYDFYKVKVFPVETIIRGLKSEKTIIEFTTHNIDKLSNAYFSVNIFIGENILDYSPLMRYIRIDDGKIYKIIENSEKYFLKRINEYDFVNFIREAAYSYMYSCGSGFLPDYVKDVIFSSSRKINFRQGKSIDEIFALIGLDLLNKKTIRDEGREVYRRLLTKLSENKKCRKIDSLYAKILADYLEGQEAAYDLGNIDEYLSCFDIFSLLRIIKMTGQIDSDKAARIFYEYLRSDVVKAEAAGLEEITLLCGYPLLLFSEEALPIFTGVRENKIQFKVWAARGSPRLYLRSVGPLNISIESRGRKIDLEGKNLSVVLDMNKNDFKNILLTIRRD